jgi:proline iminopeptidase
VERGDLMSAYHRRLTSDDEATRVAAARAWSIWEGSTSLLYPSADKIAETGADEFAVAFARIECHYFVNGGFFEVEDQLLKGVDKIRHIPTVVVQGRYDVVCPVRSAWDLYRKWPESELVIVDDAGHSAFEPGNRSALIQATDRFRT